uniref:Type I inositol3,4bisphosphate 4phosphatase-like [Bombus impatiens] n=1 Tax=Lepeophtheirus salmonis TaxID=72036 RepID=A0A0K2UL75_LEPSM
MPHTTRLPHQRALTLLHTNPVIRTYRFHSGLGGDISVQEIMAESKLCFSFPQQLLSLWICEEKELVHEIAGLGELKPPWNTCQMNWLENHLHIINAYTQALENIDNYKGPNYRKSSAKSDVMHEFVPTNYHLQRIWVENESLRKADFFDTSTVGSFTSFGNKSPGLIKMLKELKAPQKDSKAWCSQSDRLQMAEDTLTAVRRVRRQVVDCMRTLMKAGKEKKTEGMFDIVEEMLRKTKCLCSLLDQALVEETFQFLEENRVSIRPKEKDEFSESVAEFMQRNKLKIDLPLFCRPGSSNISSNPNHVNGGNPGGLGNSNGSNNGHGHGSNNNVRFETFQTPTTEFVSKELRTPEVDLFSPSDSSAEFWRTYSAYTSGYQSVDRLSDIDEFEESFKYLSVMDKTKHYYTLCRTGSPMGINTPETPSPVNSPLNIPSSRLSNESSNFIKVEQIEDEGIVGDDEREEETDEIYEATDETVIEVKMEKENSTEPEQASELLNDKSEQKISNNNKDLVVDSPSGLHYRAGDEPEPIELTHLNIEAAMMCLASKIRVLCGKADSPTLSSRTFRFKELDAARNIPKSESGGFKIPDVPKPSMMSEAQLESIDWASELRPSMRKLRQGMDALCKTARLVCSVLRLQQLHEAVDLSRSIKHRRDVCFSQALTSLLSALMARFWCRAPDLTFLMVCMELGPLVTFETLLSLHGEDVSIFNDMIVAVEDLRNVEFTLILVDKKTKKQTDLNSSSDEAKQNFIPILEYQTFPLPRVTGSRSALKVMLPVPDFVYTALPLDTIKNNTFSVTPVLFNIGINENASLAGQFCLNGPQEKNNLDNFKILSDFYRRFKTLSLPPKRMEGTRSKRNSSYTFESEIDDLLSILKNEVHNKKNKNVEILHLASNISRRLSGIRFTSCKSGKDRTGMSVTLEQVQILSREYDLAQPEFQRALDVMRSEGTRIANAQKNIGHRSFAFNSLQLRTFPYQYKPPVGSYGSKES